MTTGQSASHNKTLVECAFTRRGGQTASFHAQGCDMDLTKCTLEDFLAQSEGTFAPPAEFPRDCLVPLGTGLTFPRLRTHGDYTVVLLDPAGDVAVVDADGNEAGYYSSDSLVVHEEHRGNELATALVLYAYSRRTESPRTRNLTKGGLKALTAAWKVANGKRTCPWWP
jgi:hypothetical protein